MKVMTSVTAGLISAIFLLAGCGLMFSALSGDTVKASLPIVTGIVGAGLASAALLFYVTVQISGINEDVGEIRQYLKNQEKPK